jgi:hypothetical protein
MYGKPASEFMYDIYYNIFKDYSAEQFSYALNKCLKNRVYNTLPKPAEILEYLEGTQDDKALIAWLQVKEAIQKGGYYASIEFADPKIPHCINDLGGWTWLCCSQIGELPFIEKRFMNLYQLYSKRDIPLDNIRLIGFIEAQNNQKGYDIPEPIRIGFEIEQKQRTETIDTLHGLSGKGSVRKGVL